MPEVADLIDTPALAKKLGIQANTLEKWRVRGEGPTYVKIGRRIAYHPTDVEAWLVTCRTNSTSA
jgi:predicted DNA-binding transcriptional regulator AlpA